MNTKICALHARHSLLVALGLAISSGFVVAQQTSDVVVEAARRVPEANQPYGVVPVETVALKRRVTYTDLDLTTQAGATELEKRVNDTAKSACAELDKLYPLMAPGSPPCVKTAADDAMVQVQAAIAAAKKAHGSDAAPTK